MKACGLELVTHECDLAIAARKVVKVGNPGVFGATVPVRDVLGHEVGNRLLLAIVFYGNIDLRRRLFKIGALGQQELRIEVTGRIPVFDPAIGNHDRGTEEWAQLAVALVHDFFDRRPGRRRRDQAGKQAAGAKKYQVSPHLFSSEYQRRVAIVASCRGSAHVGKLAIRRRKRTTGSIRIQEHASGEALPNAIPVELALNHKATRLDTSLS